LDSLNRAVFDLRASLPLPPHFQADAAAPDPPATTPIVPIEELLQRAQEHSGNQRFREAEILLTRAVQTNRDDVKAWRALATVQREMAMSEVENGDLLAAARHSDRAEQSVNTVISLSVSPGESNIDIAWACEEEESMMKTKTAIREAIDKHCQDSITLAKRCADDAWRWYWRNDRAGTVHGLKQLRTVVELGPWASDQTRMSANEAFSALKHLVGSDEWNELLAQAGFDPGSRDTLKKWGLE
jgi:hypothetical protein